MKASRAAIKTAKAVVSVEERLTAVETQLAKVETQLALVNRTIQKLIAMVSADKPPGQGQGTPPKARTVRKRGGS